VSIHCTGQERSIVDDVPKAFDSQQLVMRSVLIFPRFSADCPVNEVRRLFDPAYATIRPHLTLVFPFLSAYPAKDIQSAVVSCTAGVQPFSLTLSDVVVKNTFLFMLPAEGRDKVADLFHALYSGIFAPYLPPVLEREEFIPHMTVGTCTAENAGERLAAVRTMLGTYTVLIDTVSVEIIGDDNRSIIESEITLHA